MEFDKETIQNIVDLQRLKKLMPNKTAKAYCDVFAQSINNILEEYLKAWNKVFVDIIGWGIDCKAKLQVGVWEEENEGS